MYKKVRKEFKCYEQILKIYLDAIKTVTPVISIVKKLGEVERNLAAARKEYETLASNIETLEEVIDMLKVPIRKLASEREKKQYRLNKKEEECIALENEQDNLEQQIEEYEAYASIFDWPDIQYIKDVINVDGFTKKNYYAAMFLMFNCSTRNWIKYNCPYYADIEDEAKRVLECTYPLSIPYCRDWECLKGYLKKNEEE